MGSNSLLNYDWVNDVGGSDAEFNWALDGFNDLPNVGVEIADGYTDFDGGIENNNSRKRMRDESCTGLRSKAFREKMRRERLNDRFLELGTVLEPGRPPKTDKATILSDAVRALVQLRTEAQQLKETNEKLQENIKDLKVEKNELRNEKINLKAEKEKLEEQVKAMSLPPVGFMPHPVAFSAAAFAAQSQAASNKIAAPFPGFPGAAMWQWMPPAVVDTSQDHKLRPPVA
ncbi:transcription factor ILR3-like [Telopea speciosissima]|uniref:transcription factor ILR3-like n=1 Tax=Telopea speciosissima TaxID=54955 RepID=UPI001CC444A4|nr:transcription factor ILR3-like [Telopea speciosissima]XP_043717050.1 transcription factor ILR3-like [Telopea speciosissima]XP_043717051.1 transcription factor ILR3-like [Telopea speciosissima]